MIFTPRGEPLIGSRGVGKEIFNGKYQTSVLASQHDIFYELQIPANQALTYKL